MLHLVLYHICLVSFGSFLFINHRLDMFIYCFNCAKYLLYLIAISTICNFLGLILLSISSVYCISPICCIILLFVPQLFYYYLFEKLCFHVHRSLICVDSLTIVENVCLFPSGGNSDPFKLNS